MLCGVAGPHESDPGRDPPGRARVPLASPSHIRRQQPQHRPRAARAPWGLMGSMSFVVIEDTASPVTPVVCPRESRQTGCNGANPFSILRRQAPRFSAPAPPGWSTWKLVTRLWPSPSPGADTATPPAPMSKLSAPIVKISVAMALPGSHRVPLIPHVPRALLGNK